MTNPIDQSKIVVAYPGSMSEDGLPKNISRKACRICSLAWSWTPAHSRAEDYWLHYGKSEWFVWLSYFNEFENKTDRYVIARMPKENIEPEIAISHLLTAFWTFDEKQTEPGRPHEWNAIGIPNDLLVGIIDSVWRTSK